MASPLIPRWEVLPTKALEAVFRHLGVVQLAQMRLMCRHWNAVICRSPALMEKFVLRFGMEADDLLETEHSEQEKMAELLSGRFAKAYIDVTNTARAAHSPLWAKLGPTVRHLILEGDPREDLDVADLLELLRMVPDLARLHINVQWAEVNFTATEADFKLEHLDELTLEASDVRWLGLLSGICPNLKVFKYYGSLGLAESFSVDDMMAFFLAHQETLQHIVIKCNYIDERSLRLIASANKLRLQGLTFEEYKYNQQNRTTVNAEDLILLCETFPTLQSLKLNYNYLPTTVLRDLQANLSQLRSFCIRLYRPSEYNSLKKLLSNMPQLEYLGVEFKITWPNDNYVDLRGVSCPNLKKLKISDFIFSRVGLTDFIRASPKIKHLSLKRFRANNEADLIQTLSLMKSLESLDIDGCEFHKRIIRGVKLYSLRTLCSNSVRLTACCPNLEAVRLWGGHAVVDKHVYDLLRRLPKLRHLFIDKSEENNALTDDALDFLAIEGRRLDTLHLELLGKTISKAARDRLTEALKNIVDFRYESTDGDESDTAMDIE